jgi:hypothetical protein
MRGDQACNLAGRRQKLFSLLRPNEDYSGCVSYCGAIDHLSEGISCDRHDAALQSPRFAS